MEIKKGPNNKIPFLKIVGNFLNINPKKLLSPGFWFVMILLYISVINFFVLKTTPEIIFLQYTILVLIFIRVRTKEYAKTWVPFIGFFLLYEFIRGYVDDISPFRDITLFWMYEIEMKIFKNLPTKSLQELFVENNFIINFSLFFYSIFFYYSFFVAFILWLKSPENFREYFRKFLILSFIGLAFFFLIPTAPPWMVNEIESIGIERIIYGNTILRQFSVFSLYQYFIYGNAIAAFPSLHSAWPAFTSLFLIKIMKNKVSYLFLIIPLMIGFSVVLTGEHYIVDVVAGWLLAFILVFLKESNISVTSIKS